MFKSYFHSEPDKPSFAVNQIEFRLTAIQDAKNKRQLRDNS